MNILWSFNYNPDYCYHAICIKLTCHTHSVHQFEIQNYKKSASLVPIISWDENTLLKLLIDKHDSLLRLLIQPFPICKVGPGDKGRQNASGKISES